VANPAPEKTELKRGAESGVERESMER